MVGELWDEVVRLLPDSMLGVGEASWGSQCLADHQQGVSDLVVKGGLLVVTPVEMIPVWVQGALAFVAGFGEEIWGEGWEPQLALEESGEDLWLESGVFVAAGVRGKRDAGEWAENRWEGNGNVGGCCGNSSFQGCCGSLLVEALGEGVDE